MKIPDSMWAVETDSISTEIEDAEHLTRVTWDDVEMDLICPHALGIYVTLVLRTRSADGSQGSGIVLQMDCGEAMDMGIMLAKLGVDAGVAEAERSDALRAAGRAA